MEKLNVGGQAVIEGVMMRSPGNYSVAVRAPSGKISVKAWPLQKPGRISKLFMVRGVVALYDTTVVGMKALMFSAEESSDGKDKISRKELYVSLAISLAVAVLVFFVLPFWLTGLLVTSTGIIFNLIDGIIRAAIFFAYILIISFMPDVKIMFQYHGAEHMTIHAYEAGKKLVPKEVRKFSTVHPRCGTSFILLVLITGIIIFSLVTTPVWAYRLLSRLILIPVIAGISYELLKASAKYKHNPFLWLVSYPGQLLQKITTQKPSDKQIEVAIASLSAVLDAESKRTRQSTPASP